MYNGININDTNGGTAIGRAKPIETQTAVASHERAIQTHTHTHTG